MADEKQTKAPKGKSIKKSRDRMANPPRRKYRVVEAKAKGSSVELEFSGRKLGQKGRKETFDCSSHEHAAHLAAHAPKLHARSRLSGLRYTIRKLAADFERLQAARKRAEIVGKRRAEEAAKRRRKRESEQSLRETKSRHHP